MCVRVFVLLSTSWVLDALLIGTPVRVVVVGIFAFSADEAPILGFTE